ncbi:MAG: mRNA surveillance protein Pelota [Candidatus Nitrosotenuis sp.]|nr:mRNA surveillance protein Pelota [Candidatus Nitrosotenuis sp.]
MIIKNVDEFTISFLIEETDDLLTLRRVIKNGDRVTADTTRVIKQEKDFARPDRGERIKIRIALEVEKIALDSVFDRLRIAGTIVESSSEEVSKGVHHSLLLKIGDSLNVTKKKWLPLDMRLIKKRDEGAGFVLVAIDKGDCGIGKLKGTHLQIIQNLYSGSSGKRYKSSFNIESFFDVVLGALQTVLKENDVIIVFGPGETKKQFVNHIQKSPIAKKHRIETVEGIDSGGEDGIYTFIKSKSMQQILGQTKLGKVAAILEDIMIKAHHKSKKFTMGFEETKKANQFGAIESLVFSEKIIQTHDESQIIEFLNEVEAKGVTVYALDSTTDIGMQVSGLGGMVSLLRFPVES